MKNTATYIAFSTTNYQMSGMSVYAVADTKAAAELEAEAALVNNLLGDAIPKDELLANLGLFLTSKNLSRILFLNHIYQLILDVPGVIMDFGTRYGNNMGVFTALRAIYEPYHRHRKIVGFDTFTGFPAISELDGKSDMITAGN